ncbi:MAG: HD domain-containing phosphohydrolase [Brevinematia bacterium]
MIILSFLFVFFFFSTLNAGVSTLSNWEIHFGELSPQDFEKADWKPTNKTYFEFSRKTNLTIFFRTKIPEVEAKDLILNTYHFDQYVEIYLETNKIYQYGSKDINLTSFGRHFVDLPENSYGKMIYVKVYTCFQNIGFIYPIKIGEKADIISGLFGKEMDKLILSALFILMGIAMVFLSFSTASQFQSFISVGVFSFLLGITTFCRTELRVFLFGNNAILWGYLELLSLYLAPAGMCYFFYLLNKDVERNIFGRYPLLLFILNLSFAIVISILSIVDPNILLTSLDIFNAVILFTLFSGIVNIIYLVFIRKNKEARMILYGFLIIIFFSLIDIFQDLALIPRIGFITHWGIFAFVIILINILRIRLYNVHNNLKIYARQLELDKIYIKKSHEELSFLTKELEVTQREVILRLCEIAEARSKETDNHILRVSQFSKILAELLGLSEKDIRLITLASPMHDIGKLGIPDEILNKPSKLTTKEFEIIKLHTIIGYEMLNKSKRDLFTSAATIALQHHEKYDGSGYPSGLKGNEIHIYGRIVAIADVFDSLSSDRVYKKAWSIDKVVEFIMEESGKHFDPELASILLKNIDTFERIKKRYEDQFPLSLEEELENP